MNILRRCTSTILKTSTKCLKNQSINPYSTGKLYEPDYLEVCFYLNYL